MVGSLDAPGLRIPDKVRAPDPSILQEADEFLRGDLEKVVVHRGLDSKGCCIVARITDANLATDWSEDNQFDSGSRAGMGPTCVVACSPFRYRPPPDGFGDDKVTAGVADNCAG